MKYHYLYSINEIQRTYKQVHDLLVTKHIIKNYSTNKKDIRVVALEGLNLSKVKNVLELGCGYGFFIEKLKNRLADDAKITGIDLVDNNKEAYLNSVASTGYEGEFLQGNVENIKKMQNNEFDLIITSYSLYFFPYLINEISRVLNNDGLFLSVTHSEYSLQEIIELVPQCLRDIGIYPPDTIMMNRLFQAFSSENGNKLLDPYFEEIEKIEYSNKMLFPQENIDDCVYYIEKKRNLIYKEVLDLYPERAIDLEAKLSHKIFMLAREKGKIEINKDDAIFRCYKPKNYKMVIE